MTYINSTSSRSSFPPYLCTMYSWERSIRRFVRELIWGCGRIIFLLDAHLRMEATSLKRRLCFSGDSKRTKISLTKILKKSCVLTYRGDNLELLIGQHLASALLRPQDADVDIQGAVQEPVEH